MLVSWRGSINDGPWNRVTRPPGPVGQNAEDTRQRWHTDNFMGSTIDGEREAWSRREVATADDEANMKHETSVTEKRCKDNEDVISR